MFAVHACRLAKSAISARSRLPLATVTATVKGSLRRSSRTGAGATDVRISEGRHKGAHKPRIKALPGAWNSEKLFHDPRTIPVAVATPFCGEGWRAP